MADSQADPVDPLLRRLAERVTTVEAALAHVVEVNEHLVVGAMAISADAEEAAAALEQARLAATIDGLTGLLQRSPMASHAQQALAQARRRGGHMALLFIDLDGFKALNDTWGHAFGDELLRRVALRLQDAVRGDDAVGRHGGDEFVVLLADVAGPAAARGVAHKLAGVLAQPFAIHSQAAQITASIGIAVYPDDGQSLTELLEHADAAMYAIKKRR